jgi:anti-anti-sigma factor
MTMVNITNNEDVTVFQLRGDYGSLDNDPIQQLDSEMSRHIGATDKPRVVLDLSSTRYFGGDFVNAIEHLSDKIARRSGRMALCGLTPFCAEVVKIAQLDEQLTSHATRDQAVAAVAGS